MNGSLTKRMVQPFAICSLFLANALAQVASGPVLDSPTNGATGITAPLTLSWESVDGAVYFGIQVATSTSFSGSGLPLNQTNLTVTSATAATLTAYTIYYWRAGAGTATGTTNMTWSSTWSFTTGLTAPAAPTLTAPASNATNQATALTLSWSSPATAASFGVQVSTSTSFTPNVLNSSGLSVNSAVLSGLVYSTVYYWHANATNAAGTSAWTTTRSFTTMANPAYPAVPTLNTPANNATNQTAALTLSWNSSTNALRYNVQLSTSATFTATVSNVTGLTGLSYAISNLAYSTRYYWEVNAANDSGTSAWSTVRSFTVQTNPALPGVPTLLAPSNNAANQATTVALSWNSSANALSYNVQLSLSSAFAATVSSVTGLTVLADTVSGLAYSTTYYWEVNAINDSGISAWSTVRNFTTAPLVVGAPTLALPAAGAMAIKAPVALSWGTAANAVSYTVQISTDLGFSSFAANSNGITATSYTVSSLAAVQTYFWRVQGVSGSTVSAWSNTWWFSLSATATIPDRMKAEITKFSVANQAIDYSIAQPMPVSIAVYNLLGRQVCSFSRLQAAGSYSFALWKQGLSAGRYIVHFKAGNIDKRVTMQLFGRR